MEVFDVRVGGGGCLGFYRERFGWKLAGGEGEVLGIVVIVEVVVMLVVV